MWNQQQILLISTFKSFKKSYTYKLVPLIPSSICIQTHTHSAHTPSVHTHTHVHTHQLFNYLTETTCSEKKINIKRKTQRIFSLYKRGSGYIKKGDVWSYDKDMGRVDKLPIAWKMRIFTVIKEYNRKHWSWREKDSILDTIYMWSLGSIHIGKSWMVESRQNYNIYDTSLIKIAI